VIESPHHLALVADIRVSTPGFSKPGVDGRGKHSGDSAVVST
jgi:hypothetical protein